MNKGHQTNHTLRGILFTTIGGVCWGASGTCGQYLFSNFTLSPEWLASVRLIIAGTILTLLALFRHPDRLPVLFRQPRELCGIFNFGLFGMMLCQYAYLRAIQYSNAPTTTLLQNLSLILVMLLSCIKSRRRPIPREALALVLALGGIYLLATGGDPRHMALSWAGLIWGLITALAATAYTILPKKLTPRWGWEIVTGIGMLFGGLALGLITRAWRFFPVILPLRGWLAALGVIGLGSLIAFPMFIQGVADIGPVRSSMLAATEPVASVVLSVVCLGSRFSLASLAGFACIFSTIFLLAREGPQKTQASPSLPVNGKADGSEHPPV